MIPTMMLMQAAILLEVVVAATMIMLEHTILSSL
jgi:hypothetical protein